MRPTTHNLKELRKRLVEIAHIASVHNVLSWDQEVHMPKKGIGARAEALAGIGKIIHEKTLALDRDGLLTTLKHNLDAGKIRREDAIIVAETWRTFERQKKLPVEFVSNLSKTLASSQHAWGVAKERNDFASFLPHLRKVIVLKQQEASLVGYAHSPYDALLDAHEPGMTTEEITRILDDLKLFLLPFLKKIRGSKQPKLPVLTGKFPLSRQKAFNEYVAKKIGFDFEAGRIDISTHPFTTTFHQHDVRITTRYRENDILYSIGSTIHEVGHALYEQGLPHQHFGTPLAESVSFGIHESQSRLWENNIGKSRPFWAFLYPHLKKEFPAPFKAISLDEFYRAINAVRPSLIRTEADELTYNLHIILRFEIERALIEGTLNPKDLPAVWSDKMRAYLGISVPDDARGVLQDVHWSLGAFGYFPTYALGNIYAAQLYHTMQKRIPNLSTKISRGNLSEPREWLREAIHAHGKQFTANELIKKVTGEPPTSKYLIDYFQKKYGALYALSELS